MGREHIFGRAYGARARTGTRRSAIPRVVGILLLVFGGLGLAGSVFGVIGSAALAALAGVSALLVVANLVGVAVAGLQIAAGVALVRYRANGITLARAYAITNIVTTVAYAIASFVWVDPAIAGLGGETGLAIAISLVSLAWPIVVLALVARPAAKTACAAR